MSREPVQVDSDEGMLGHKGGSEGEKEEVPDTMQEGEENDGIEENIDNANKIGDLSPRHTDSLQAKSGKSQVPLQVRIRNSKGKARNCTL